MSEGVASQSIAVNPMFEKLQREKEFASQQELQRASNLRNERLQMLQAVDFFNDAISETNSQKTITGLLYVSGGIVVGIIGAALLKSAFGGK